MKTNTESQFSYRSMTGHVSDGAGVRRVPRKTRPVVGVGGSNMQHAMRQVMGQRVVYSTASPILLARATSVQFGRTTISNSSGGGSFSFPMRTTLFKLPSDMSQDHIVIPMYIAMMGWAGENTDPAGANPSKSLKFSCGVSTSDPELDFTDTENYTNIISNRHVRFIQTSTAQTEDHAVGLGILPDISSSWNAFRAEIRQWQMGDFNGLGCAMGNLGSAADQYLVLESDKDDTTGLYWGMVDVVALYGMVYRSEPNTQVVYKNQSYTVAYTPKNIPDLELWMTVPLADATITDSETVAATAWPDSSGEDNDPDAGNGGSLDEDSVNSLPSIVFDGSSDYFRITDTNVADYTASSDDYAIFVVFQCDTGNTGRLVCRTHGSGGRQFRTEVASDVLRGNFGNTSYVVSTSTVTGTSFGIGSFHINDDKNKVLLYWNGAYEDSEGTGTTTHTNSGPTIGASLDSSSLPQVYFEGKIAEVIIIGHFVGETERQKIEGYLAHKYGLTGSLASTHPHKTDAPTQDMEFTEYQS